MFRFSKEEISEDQQFKNKWKDIGQTIMFFLTLAAIGFLYLYGLGYFFNMFLRKSGFNYKKFDFNKLK